MKKAAPVRWRLVFGLVLLVICAIPFAAMVALPAMAQAPQTLTAPRLNVPILGLDFTKYPSYYSANKGTITIPFLAAYVDSVYQYLLGISIVAAAIMIVYGGFHYIVGSSMAKIGRAKEIISDAVVGLILILGSVMVLTTINATAFTRLKPLEVQYIEPLPIRISEKYSEGVPLESMPSFAKPSVEPTSSVAPGEIQQGCGNPKYKTPSSLCAAQSDCEARFCKAKDLTPPPGLPDPKELVGFIDVFPPTQKEQILEKGLAFFPISELCAGAKGCSTTKLFNVTTHGPKASKSNQYRMLGGMIFRPEARDALVRAGEEAKKRGYFLIIGDGTRTMEGVAQAWCGRIAKTGGALGLAPPGSSPHMLGIAVDIALYQLIDDGKRYRQLTVVGICKQVENQELIGLQYMRTLEEIMASAGFKHLASEVHHFDYGGAYESDCTTGEWPGKYKTREDNEKGCK